MALVTRLIRQKEMVTSDTKRSLVDIRQVVMDTKQMEAKLNRTSINIQVRICSRILCLTCMFTLQTVCVTDAVFMARLLRLISFFFHLSYIKLEA